MNKVIGGKRYNTDSARLIWKNPSKSTGRDACEETLYLKQGGEFFLHGVGGSKSKYAQYVGDEQWADGENILPLTDSEAKAWAEEHMPCERCEELFQEVSGDEETMVGFKVKLATKNRLVEAAKERGITMTALFEELVARIPPIEPAPRILFEIDNEWRKYRLTLTAKGFIKEEDWTLTGGSCKDVYYKCDKEFNAETEWEAEYGGNLPGLSKNFGTKAYEALCVVGKRVYPSK